MRYDNIIHDLPTNPERFDPAACIMGKEGFSSGRSHCEVQVEGKIRWALGLARESIDRKGRITLNLINGFYTVRLRLDEYVSNAGHGVPLTE